jgi:hypothetical protein
MSQSVQFVDRPEHSQTKDDVSQEGRVVVQKPYWFLLQAIFLSPEHGVSDDLRMATCPHNQYLYH